MPTECIMVIAENEVSCFTLQGLVIDHIFASESIGYSGLQSNRMTSLTLKTICGGESNKLYTLQIQAGLLCDWARYCIVQTALNLETMHTHQQCINNLEGAFVSEVLVPQCISLEHAAQAASLLVLLQCLLNFFTYSVYITQTFPAPVEKWQIRFFKSALAMFCKNIERMLGLHLYWQDVQITSSMIFWHWAWQCHPHDLCQETSLV